MCRKILSFFKIIISKAKSLLNHFCFDLSLFITFIICKQEYKNNKALESVWANILEQME